MREGGRVACCTSLRVDEFKLEETARPRPGRVLCLPIKQCTSGVEEAPHTPHPNVLQGSYSVQGKGVLSGGTHCLYGRSPVPSSHSRTPRA